MKIFISWSSERSQALAQALNDWLKPILHYAEPWCSTSDIKSGDRWGSELAKVLQDTNFGILCVTSDNLNAPWLLFEAGALAKSIDEARVIPLLLDLEKSDLSGPLTQFQAEKADKAGIRRLAESLNSVSPTAISNETLATLFEALWPQLEAKIAEIPASASPQKKSRPQGEVLEELVAGVRSVEMRVRDVFEENPDFRMRRRRRFHPEMIMEMRHRLLDGPNDPIQLLFVAGLMREDAPWIYELALEAYRAVRSGNRKEIRPALGRFKDALHMLMRGPFFDVFADSKMLHMTIRDALEFMPSFEPEDTDVSEGSQSPARRKKRTDLGAIT